MDLTPPPADAAPQRAAPDDLADVVPMNEAAAFELAIIRARKPETPKCVNEHRRIEVDSEERLIKCRDCGHFLDPFDYIDDWAKKADHRMAGLKAIEIQRRIAQMEHDDLQRKVNNLRQQLKRAGQPQPPTERQHYQTLRWNPHLVPCP